jgi:ArsR family transcriptional regulator, arsenate/arsenite/antimonite-responsive transcriptional repressor
MPVTAPTENARAARIANLAYAFSDPLRVRIIAILRETSGVCNCEFQSKLGLSQSKASYHLKILMDAGLIEREARGTWSYYSITDRDRVDRLYAALEIGGT